MLFQDGVDLVNLNLSLDKDLSFSITSSKTVGILFNVSALQIHLLNRMSNACPSVLSCDRRVIEHSS